MAELEMDLNVPLLETGLPEKMPMRFRKLLNPDIQLPDETKFEENPLQPEFEFRLLLTSLFFFVLGLPLLTVGIAGIFGRIEISLLISGLIVLLGLAVLFVGVGYFLSSASAKKLRLAQEGGRVRLGNFYCEEALLQNHGNCVYLIPKSLFVRLEINARNSGENAEIQLFAVVLIYRGAFDRECRLKLRDAKNSRSIQPMTLGELEQWAGCELREI